MINEFIEDDGDNDCRMILQINYTIIIQLCAIAYAKMHQQTAKVYILFKKAIQCEKICIDTISKIAVPFIDPKDHIKYEYVHLM